MGMALILCLSTSAIAKDMAAGSKDAGSKELIFGFLPILSTEKLVARFGPLVDYLEKQLGQPVQFETAPDYPEFVRRTNVEKRYDIVFTAPHFYYLAQRKADYRVIVRVGAPKMQAVIVATKSSGMTKLSDLKGRSLATPADESLATALVRATLREAGLDPDKDLKLVNTPTHNASLLTAYKGVTEAASLMIPPYKRAGPEVRAKMVVLATTRGVPHMPIAVSSRVPDDIENKLRQALLALKDSEEGRVLLKHLSWPMGFSKAIPAEYDSVSWAAQEIK
jgi:phosphonate transport system substrate-binding protein